MREVVGERCPGREQGELCRERSGVEVGHAVASVPEVVAAHACWEREGPHRGRAGAVRRALLPWMGVLVVDPGRDCLLA